VFGINPVLEALRGGRVTELRVSEGASGRASEIEREAIRAGIPVWRVGKDDLDRAVRGQPHQGVIAEVVLAPSVDLLDVCGSAESPALIVVLDGIEDPHNVGAILRSVDAAGGTGVVRQSRRAAALEGAAARASAGAIAHVKIAEVVNIARAIEELKEQGIWTVGLAAEGSAIYDQIDLTLPTALVVGGEGDGLRRLVRERCDWLATIPMHGRIGSLNVSVATGIALFEAARQRRVKAQPGGSHASDQARSTAPGVGAPDGEIASDIEE
jgi:23S rRNA (guanosine2251-2'-O)-methyltransferase